jgi:hypothetical protein
MLNGPPPLRTPPNAMGDDPRLRLQNPKPRNQSKQCLVPEKRPACAVLWQRLTRDRDGEHRQKKSQPDDFHPREPQAAQHN